jgi:hypothetical protein
METQLADLLRPLLGLILGGTIGLGFGLMQTAAQRRYHRRQEGGQLKTGWALVPGSMSRVAYLLIALVLVQVISPAMFAGSGAWWVSAGVAIGYSALLGWQLYRRRTALQPASPRPS